MLPGTFMPPPPQPMTPPTPMPPVAYTVTFLARRGEDVVRGVLAIVILVGFPDYNEPCCQPLRQRFGDALALAMDMRKGIMSAVLEVAFFPSCIQSRSGATRSSARVI